ncbi:MAG: hypothetical protein HOI95_14465 [Chromatiales bacterium]|nr:hypothetical protein [Chromatiales bacterium]
MPTSPVSSALSAGTYVFGVDGGPFAQMHPDHTVAVLPGNPSIHLNF